MSIANELITRGWVQREMEADSGGVCLWGAVCHAIHGDSLYGTDANEERERAAMDLIENVLLDGRSVPFWNDAPDRTFDDVLRVAKQADELLDAQ